MYICISYVYCKKEKRSLYICRINLSGTGISSCGWWKTLFGLSMYNNTAGPDIRSLSAFLSLSIYLFIYLSISIYLYLSIYLSIYLSMYLSTCR